MEDANYVGEVERVVLIPGAKQALRRLQDAGYKLFVVTNQSAWDAATLYAADGYTWFRASGCETMAA